MLILLINFLRQPVRILGELLPHESFSQTSRMIPLIKFLFIYRRFSRWKSDWQLLWFLLFWLVLLFMVALSIYAIFRIWEKSFNNTCYKSFAIISFALLQSSRFNLRVYFTLFRQTPNIEMPSLNRNQKLLVTIVLPKKLNLARH